MSKKIRQHVNKIKIATLGICFSLAVAPIVAISTFQNQNVVEAKAADYSGVSGGFSKGADGSVSASFTVTKNDLDMRGWLLCLFESKPDIGSDNKLIGSNDVHPYSHSACKYYFFASNTSKTGSISVTWAANSGDQKTNWTSGTSTGTTGNTLKDIINNGTNWHLIIGPRHYNTSWSGSGVGAGKDGYWENCDYYVGSLQEVFPSEDKDMTVSVQSYVGTYNGTDTDKSISVNVTNPSSGYTIKYRTSSSGEYNLNTSPKYKDAGNYTVYFQVTASGYKAYSGSGTIKINKADPTYTAPQGKVGLKYVGEDQNLVDAGSTSGGTLKYSLDGSTYSTTIPTGKTVGSYTVYYKIDGDNNYNSIDAKTISVSISPNDKTALGESLTQVSDYLKAIINEYPDIGSVLNNAISTANEVYEDDNKTVFEIASAKASLIDAYDLAHAQITDLIINNIGEVRLTDKCLENILEAETSYSALSDEQQALVTAYDTLLAARDLYNRLTAVQEAISSIGEVSYDEECYNRIIEAKELYDALSKDEQKLIPTLFNELVSALDIYNVLDLIHNLGKVEYTEAYKNALDEARNAYDALDHEEQEGVFNYQDLLAAEKMYSNVDHVVQLVEQIGEVSEYVGTHNPDIDKARKAYDALSEEEKALIPELTYTQLVESEEEYQELKVEHERKEVEDREAGVVIATEGGSGIPDTVSIDINNSSSTSGSSSAMSDNIDYEVIGDSINNNEAISSICSIKLYQEVEGEIVEVSLSDIEEGMTVVIKLDVPSDIDDSDFYIVLLDEDNNVIEVEYTYDRNNRVASISTDKVGTFAIITPIKEEVVNKGNLWLTILLAVISILVIGTVGYFSIREKRKKIS